MNKFGGAVTKVLSFGFLIAMGVIFIGRLVGEWSGDPLIPLLVIVVISTNAAIYQMVLATFGGIVAANQKLEAPPVSLSEQIERQASQN